MVGKRKSKIKIKDPFYVLNVDFFKVPLAFQLHMKILSQSEKDVYIGLLTQVYYRKSLSIEMPVDTICYWTGIKSVATVTNAIKGLAEKGWIKDIIYQKQKPNIYVLNLEPTVNVALLEKMKSRSENTREAKIKSIRKGESGKFQSVESTTEGMESTKEQNEQTV